ncbi:MAG: hypothetical protein KF752_13135 [Pirellulaceae bacterium]|nr:hypothetical protein [Pirellulaceae bacterium]
MDWIDPKASAHSRKADNKPKKSKKSGNLGKQVAAALAQPIDVWSAAFEYEIASLKWPSQINLESTWLWSALIPEQAEVLVRAGVSGRRIAELTKSQSASDDKQRLSAVSGLMHQPLEDLAMQWLDQADSYPRAALGVIATAWHLPSHARRQNGQHFAEWLREACKRTVENWDEPSQCLLGNLVFHCELPLLLQLLTATSSAAAQTGASRSMDDLAEYLENSQDHVGSWLDHGAMYLRAALASVVRCRTIADHLGLREWYKPQKKALEQLLEHAARWARSDGSQLLTSAAGSTRWSSAIWSALCKQASAGPSVRSALTLSGLLPGDRNAAKVRSLQRIPKLSHHDDEALCAVFQHAWHHRGARVAVDFSEPLVNLEAIGPKGSPLIQGGWSATVDRRGQVQQHVDSWEHQCWHSDEDVDYLEMETRFGDSARLQRQLMLLRKQRLLLVADALICDHVDDWRLTSRLTMGRGVEWQTDGRHTEGCLRLGSAGCLVVPLYLSEWRSATNRGSLSAQEHELIVESSCTGGRAIFMPLVISLCNRPARQDYTWRQLTVAEDLQLVARDQAAAYRLQLGKQQLVFYRNLSQVTRRTVLGAHLLCDFYAGTFDKDSGLCDELVEIAVNH